MNRKHATGIALLIALAAIAGLGSSATTALVQARTAQLDRYETALRKRVAAVDAQLTGSTGAVTDAAPAAQKIVYVRPAPIVRTSHRSHDGEGGSKGESDD